MPGWNKEKYLQGPKEIIYLSQKGMSLFLFSILEAALVFDYENLNQPWVMLSYRSFSH